MPISKKLLVDAFGWGFLLWLFGYLLGFIAFMFVSVEYIGWVITPIGIVITIWVLFKKIISKEFEYFFKIGVFWVIIAVLFDYIFIVKLLAPEDGYYKLDVYLYYTFTLTLPLLVGWIKTNKKSD